MQAHRIRLLTILPTWPAPDRPEVIDRGRERRERRPAGVERRAVAAAHDQELAFLRRAFAAAERDVEQRDLRRRRQPRRDPLHGLRRDGRGDRDRRCRRGRRRARRCSPNITASTSWSKPTTMMTRSLAAATACGDIDAVCMPASAAASIAPSRDVEARDREAALHQVARHRQAHLAEPDQAHAADVIDCATASPRCDVARCIVACVACAAVHGTRAFA